MTKTKKAKQRIVSHDINHTAVGERERAITGLQGRTRTRTWEIGDFDQRREIRYHRRSKTILVNTINQLLYHDAISYITYTEGIRGKTS